MRSLLLAALVLGVGCQKTATTFPTCGDNITNGDETDVDCGGPLCTPCNSGKRCLVAKDCRNLICAGNVCVAPTCSDGVMNGSESDVDCGGPDCTPCDAGKLCSGFNDCASHVCTGLRCQAPTCSDGFQNGDELGVDCGGACAPCDAAVVVPKDLSSGGTD